MDILNFWIRLLGELVDFTPLTSSDLIQLLMLAAIISYVIFTYRISKATQKSLQDTAIIAKSTEQTLAENARIASANEALLEQSTRPRITIKLASITEEAVLKIIIHNPSNTDAICLVRTDFLVAGKRIDWKDPAYDGSETWFLPATQAFRGYKEISAELKQLNALGNSSVGKRLIVRVYYIRYDPSNESQEIIRYNSAPLMWSLKYEKGRTIWIPEITKRKGIPDFQPNWDILLNEK